MRYIHPITRRGFFSEYLIALWMKLHCDLNGDGFALAFGPRSLVSRDFAVEHFNIDILPVWSGWAYKARFRAAEVVRKPLRPLVVFEGGPFAPPLWTQLISERGVRDLAARIDLLQAMHQLHRQTWRPGDVALSQFKALGNAYAPGSYVALHVRRGDKLVHEAQHVDVKDYCALIPEELRDLPVLVVSDDYRAFEETGAHLAASARQVEVATTAPVSAAGYDQKTFMRRGLRERDRAALALLADFELLCSAAFVVCSFSSNVGRAVHIARAGKGTASIDSPFAFLSSANRWRERDLLVAALANHGVTASPADLPDLIGRVVDRRWESGETMETAVSAVAEDYFRDATQSAQAPPGQTL